ncbi:Phosphatidylinositol-4-phosphate 5-kinase [Apophysomyces ossiformis]|uniref:1-phosphatidylinositol-4-phosphate 5-kinase n=1 Tax=Apophysomyces ossiformis TaxID=679940 RepID=A0A8H7C041_9FUNG|nr:Phosphatidylinositol-4-phosphate 5-kinase [Apophysomyces ossiformis]
MALVAQSSDNQVYYRTTPTKTVPEDNPVHDIFPLAPAAATNSRPQSITRATSSSATVNDFTPPEIPPLDDPAIDQREPLIRPRRSFPRKESLARSHLSNDITIASAETEPVRHHEEELAIKRHSTGFNLQKKNKRRSLARNNSTLEQEISEDFEKELSARRKAFRRLSRYRYDDDDDRVLMGTRISEGHQNYVLMYNMLTGIRIAVGRVSAKADRPLTDEDFAAAHKLVFDVTGDELTPGAKYDFKFKDYAPWAFRHLRERFGIDPADYLISLTSKYILSELGSPGKSGSFFYYSRDYRFIIKTIHHTEHKFMRKILRQYHDHVCNNPDTLLCRYYGLHRVKLPHGRKIHFVVMGNVFPPNKDIHETYDLKGSTFGRFLPEEEIKKNPYAVMKDLNWEKRGNKLVLGPHKRRIFINQLLRDVKLLVRLNIMDYSLLVGVHNLLRGNKDGVRDSTLQFFQPDTKLAERRASMMKRRESKAQVYRKAIAQANPDRMDASKLPDQPFEERRNCIFYSDDGGFQATDELNQPTAILYFVGVIDILTPYDMKKKSEHFFKSMTQDKNTISSVKPSHYGDRFMGFMTKALAHNEDVPHEYHLQDV